MEYKEQVRVELRVTDPVKPRDTLQSTKKFFFFDN